MGGLTQQEIIRRLMLKATMADPNQYLKKALCAIPYDKKRLDALSNFYEWQPQEAVEDLTVHWNDGTPQEPWREDQRYLAGSLPMGCYWVSC